MTPCPFCGKPVDLEDEDTLYPSGTGWLFDEELQMKTYHRMTDVPKSQWCWSMNCPTNAGGCGAEITGHSRQEAIDKWEGRAVWNEVDPTAADNVVFTLPDGETFALPTYVDPEGVRRFVPNKVIKAAWTGDPPLLDLNRVAIMYNNQNLPLKDVIVFWASLGYSVSGLKDFPFMEGVTTV